MSSTVTRRRSNSARRKPRLPSGLIAGLSTACAVTLFGVFSGYDPSVVLTKAFFSACLLGVLVSAGSSIIRLANIDNGPIDERPGGSGPPPNNRGKNTPRRDRSN